MLEIASNEVKRAQLGSAPQLIQLTYFRYSSRNIWPENRADYLESYSQDPKFPYTNPLLNVVSGTSSLTELASLRDREKRAARSKWQQEKILMIVDWIGLGAALFAIAFMVRRFARLVSAGEKKGRTVILVAELLLFALDIFILGATWSGALFTLSIVVIPFVWLYQLYLSVRWQHLLSPATERSQPNH
jgi:hypothetical protein